MKHLIRYAFRVLPVFAMAVVSHSAASAETLQVQFKQSAGADTQTGFTQIVSGGASGSTTISGGEFDGVGVTGAGTHYRSHTAGASYLSVNHSDGDLDALLSGGVLTNSSGSNVTLTLTGLADGNYDVTTYHHTPYSPTDGANFDVRLTDGAVTNSTVHSTEPISFGSPVTTAGLAALTTSLTVNGNATTTLTFDPATGFDGDGSDHLNLNGFELTATGPFLPTLKIDFGRDTNGNDPLQSGDWMGQNHVGNASTAKTTSYVSPHGTNGNVKVTTNSPFWRDYPAITSGPFVGQSDLLSDLILTNAETQQMTITLENLNDGQYNIKTYHHMTANSGVSNFDIILDDASGTTVPHTGLQTTGINTNPTNPTSITTVETSFLVSGGNAVTLTFDPTSSGHAGVNAFELSLIPEPSAFALAALGLLGLLAWGRRRRR